MKIKMLCELVRAGTLLVFSHLEDAFTKRDLERAQMHVRKEQVGVKGQGSSCSRRPGGQTVADGV